MSRIQRSKQRISKRSRIQQSNRIKEQLEEDERIPVGVLKQKKLV